MKHTLLTITILLFAVTSFAQPYLKPHIGLTSLPADADAICTIPTYTGSFYTSGFQNGDTIPDFTLYTPAGTAVNAKTLLQSGKPLLLINGSYTCPVFRGKITDFNDMLAYYGSQLQVYIVYTVEAHPNVDVSPYSGNVWVTSANQSQGVLYRQPTTYGARKAVVDSMLKHLSITPTVLIDGPCNNWWSNFGPAPNNAYLIDTNGIVRAKHGWFHKLPDNMWCNIDTLLGTTSGKCNSVANNGNFTFALDKDSIVVGTAGNTLEIHSTIRNTSATETVTIDIMKLQKNLPTGWQTALCTDICLDATVDSTQVTIAPLDTQSFIFYFYTDATPASGDVQIGLRNVNNNSNRYRQKMHATTFPATVNSVEKNRTKIQLTPNPAEQKVTITLSSLASNGSVAIINIMGQVLYTQQVSQATNSITIPLHLLPEGIYMVLLQTQDGRVIEKLVKR